MKLLIALITATLFALGTVVPAADAKKPAAAKTCKAAKKSKKRKACKKAKKSCKQKARALKGSKARTAAIKRCAKPTKAGRTRDAEVEGELGEDEELLDESDLENEELYDEPDVPGDEVEDDGGALEGDEDELIYA